MYYLLILLSIFFLLNPLIPLAPASLNCLAWCIVPSLHCDRVCPPTLLAQASFFCSRMIAATVTKQEDVVEGAVWGGSWSGLWLWGAAVQPVLLWLMGCSSLQVLEHTLLFGLYISSSGWGGLWCAYTQYFKSIMSHEGSSLYQMMPVGYWSLPFRSSPENSQRPCDQVAHAVWPWHAAQDLGHST